MTTAAERGPKQDRSRMTRRRLLSATIELLAEDGWNATTVVAVAERAGVSRGAAQHHFPVREDLITAALEFMFDERTGLADQELGSTVSGSDRTERIVSRLVEYYTGPLFRAALQVWTAAAADPQLRDRILPLEDTFGRRVHRVAVRQLGVDDNDPVSHRLVQATLDLARGLGLAGLLSDDSRRRAEVIRAWSTVLDGAFAAGARTVV